MIIVFVVGLVILAIAAWLALLATPSSAPRYPPEVEILRITMETRREIDQISEEFTRQVQAQLSEQSRR